MSQQSASHCVHTLLAQVDLVQASQAAQSNHHNAHTRFVGTSTLNVSVSLRSVTLLQGGLMQQTCFQMLGKSITCHFMNQACVCLQPPTMLWTSSGLRAAPYSTYDRSVAFLWVTAYLFEAEQKDKHCRECKLTLHNAEAIPLPLTTRHMQSHIHHTTFYDSSRPNQHVQVIKQGSLCATSESMPARTLQTSSPVQLLAQSIAP